MRFLGRKRKLEGVFLVLRSRKRWGKGNFFWKASLFREERREGGFFGWVKEEFKGFFGKLEENGESFLSEGGIF